MGNIYGHIWYSSFGKPDAVAFWENAFKKARLTKTDLARGIEKVLDADEDFPPTLPRFLKLCRLSEADLNIPSFEEAYHEATVERGRIGDYWTWARQVHPAIYHAIKGIGTDLFSFNRMPETQARKVFRESWNFVLNRLLSGEQLKPAPVVIDFKPQNGHTETKKGLGSPPQLKPLRIGF